PPPRPPPPAPPSPGTPPPGAPPPGTPPRRPASPPPVVEVPPPEPGASGCGGGSFVGGVPRSAAASWVPRGSFHHRSGVSGRPEASRGTPVSAMPAIPIASGPRPARAAHSAKPPRRRPRGWAGRAGSGGVRR
ncbi:hypothetical protein E1292_29635, partial [Nonomuraea deserti]